MNDSQRLLAEYAKNGSEAAFAELVSRYINLVYSTAIRMLDGDADSAKDVVQLVFVDLARNAPNLSSNVMLGGWLHRHACFVVSNLKRSERRRQSRERKAVAMNALEDHSEENLIQMRPLLDEAINELEADDRTAILLRFFEQYDYSSVGAALGSSENAAQKRVYRALEELRALLARRGVILSAAVLGTVLAGGVVSAAPAGLAATVSGAALTAAASRSATTFNFLKFMAMSKTKLSIAGALLAAGAATVVILVLHYEAVKGTISFDGQRWHPWKTQFAVRGDKLVSLPKARPGFDYGHDGGGRGPTLMAAIGDSNWKNYRAEFEYCVTGPNPSFNPYGLPADYHDGAIFFHVADAKENWNQCGNSLYILNVQGSGAWSLLCIYNSYCAVPSGWGNLHTDAERKLAEGEGLKIDPNNGNKYVIEVNKSRIQIWVDDQQIADVTDDKMGKAIGGKTLDHGGVGFQWGLDAMGWIRNFSLKRL